MILTINRKEFTLVGALRWNKLPQYAPQVRTTSEQLRSDRSPIPEWSPADLSGGLGRKYYRSDRSQYHFGSAMTLWPRQVTLPLLYQTPTFSGTSLVHITAMTPLNGRLYGFYKDGQSLKCARWDSGNAWTELATVSTGVLSFVGAKTRLTKLWVIYADASNALKLRTSTDGVTWSAAVSLTGNPPAALAVSPTTDTAYYASYNPTALTALVYSSPDLATWSVIGGGVQSGYGPKGLELFPDSAGTERPHLGIPEGVFQALTGAYPSVLSLFGMRNNANGLLAKWGIYLAVSGSAGALYLLKADGTIIPFGLDSGDGLPADYLGDITAIYPERWLLFAAVKGTKSGVYVLDGAGWHPVWLGVTQWDIQAVATDGSSGTPALVLSGGPGQHRFIDNYHSNPLEISGAQYEERGWLDYPIYGGDLPEALATFYHASADAYSLLAGNEELEFHLGLDGEEPQTSIGVINSQGAKLWIPGHLASGRTVQLRVWLRRRTSVTTATPVLRAPVIGTTRAGSVLLSISCEVDLKATAGAWGKPQSEVVRVIEAWLAAGASRLSWRDWDIKADLQSIAVKEGLHDTVQLTFVQI